MPQRRPKVTIGLCIKNCEAIVSEAVDSILRQDYPHELMEVIVVDGYSRDKTLSIVKELLSKSDIKYKFFQENEGLGKARQIVVDNANGDYIIWVDADVILAKDHVRKQVEFMESNPNIGIAGGKFMMFPLENLIAMLESVEWIVTDNIHGKKASLKPTLHRAGGSVYRVKAIRQAGGIDCNITGALEDLDIEYRIGNLGWLTYFCTDAIFYDKRKENWKAIWNENFWYGYGGHYFMHKHGKSVRTSAFLEGFRRTAVAYKLTRQKIVFLLLFQYLFKKIAWLSGFLKAHLEGYGH